MAASLDLFDARREQAKKDYVRGKFRSLRELADFYQIGYTTAWRWFRRGHWEEAWRAEAEKQGKSISELDAAQLRVWQALQGVLIDRLKLAKADPNDPDRAVVPISTRELHALCCCMGRIQIGARLAAGLHVPRKASDLSVTVDLAKLIEQHAAADHSVPPNARVPREIKINVTQREDGEAEVEEAVAGPRIVDAEYKVKDGNGGGNGNGGTHAKTDPLLEAAKAAGLIVRDKPGEKSHFADGAPPKHYLTALINRATGGNGQNGGEHEEKRAGDDGGDKAGD